MGTAGAAAPIAVGESFPIPVSPYHSTVTARVRMNPRRHPRSQGASLGSISIDVSCSPPPRLPPAPPSAHHPLIRRMQPRSPPWSIPPASRWTPRTASTPWSPCTTSHERSWSGSACMARGSSPTPSCQSKKLAPRRVPLPIPPSTGMTRFPSLPPLYCQPKSILPPPRSTMAWRFLVFLPRRRPITQECNTTRRLPLRPRLQRSSPIHSPASAIRACPHRRPQLRRRTSSNTRWTVRLLVVGSAGCRVHRLRVRTAGAIV